MSHTRAQAIDPEAVSTVGSPIVRREDPTLVTGEGQYTDDISVTGMLHTAILRSQYGHARIASIDTAAAEAHPEVVAVYTAEDIEASGCRGEILSPNDVLNPGPDSPISVPTPIRKPFRPLLAGDVVRHVGEGVAVVVATDRYAAHTARDLIEVDYEPLDAVSGVEAALDGGAPQLHDEAPGNIAYDWENGDADAVDVACEEADHVVELDLRLPRLIPNAIEPRGTLADYSPTTGRLEVTVTTQSAFSHRSYLSTVLGVPEHKIHVVVPPVGGGFGSKSKFYAGEVLAAWCSIQLGRPVKWQNTRTQAHATDAQGRAHNTTARIAFDDDGTIRALSAHTHIDLGGYVSAKAPFQTGGYGILLSGLYRIPALHVRITGVFTNATPVDAYRGAGRPEAAYVVERLVHLAARRLGMDPAEIRRRNFIPPDALPYQTPIFANYDSGDYEATFDRALEMVGYDEFRERQASLREEGRYLGIGICSFIERAAGGTETCRLRVHPNGAVTAYVGSVDNGQGHPTPFTQLISSYLGIPFGDIDIVEGDTETLPTGSGSFGSRTAVMAGNAILRSAEQVVERGKEIAGHRLETAVDDIEFEDGTFSVRGAPERSIGFADVAAAAYSGDLPEGMDPGFEETAVYEISQRTYPYGTHIAVVEIDADTGEVDLRRYVGVDDCGTIINPTIVEGQIQGGVVQGIGQALFEEAVFDGSGNLLTGSLQDYAMPRAMHLPDIETDHTVTPSPRNPLGAKGAGESGTIGSPAAVANAVADALAPFGVEHVDLPITDEKAWRAMNVS